MNNKLLMMTAAAVIGLGGLAAASADAAMVVQLGTIAPQLNSATANDTGLSAGYVTGTLATTNENAVTFDLAITGTNGSAQFQNQAVGISGGIVGGGIDNNNAQGPQEVITFTISDFQGLDAGQSLVITALSVWFADTAESFILDANGDGTFSASTNFTVDTTGGAPSDPMAVNGTTASIGAGTTGDTRFAIDSITIDVVSDVPEPASVAMGLAGLALVAGRRRRG